MATINLPDHILEALSTVLQQLQQNLPELKQETDFSASAYKWQDKQLKAIQQPKKIYLDDLKGIETRSARHAGPQWRLVAERCDSPHA